MPGGSGSMKIGALGYKTKKIYLLGGLKLKEGEKYDWNKWNKILASGVGVERSKKKNRFDKEFERF